MTTPTTPGGELASQYGLHHMGIRPPLREYIKQLRERRHFTWLLAKSKAFAENQSLYLGQLWSILNPIMNATVYIIIFGLMLGTRQGINNVAAYIVVGTFVFRLFHESVTAGSKSIRGNLNLVRSLHFPRAILPISTAMATLLAALPALLVMMVIVWLTGFLPEMNRVSITWSWFLIIPAVALITLFNVGCSFIIARLVAQSPDVSNLIPFILRFVMYGSGVIFAIERFVTTDPALWLMQHQPVAVYLHLARVGLLDEPTVPPDHTMWLWGAGWALLALAIGFFYFWRAEARYGRD